MDPMTNPGDHASWPPPADGSQPTTGGETYGRQNPYGEVPADPWAPPSAGDPAPWSQPPAEQGADPYGQGAGQSPYGAASGASASDPYGQGAGQSPYGAASGASASDPYGQQSWTPAGGAAGQQPAGGQPAAGQPLPAGELGQSRLLVGLLGIFLGGFGVHRFLLGYTTIGIIQIGVTILTCGIGAWWGVIEGIMVLARAQTFERDAHGRPLAD